VKLLRGVLCGGGFFAAFHMDAWKRMGDGATIEALVEPDPVRAQAFASQWSIPKTYANFDEMLGALGGEKPDFVDIATRPDTHLPLTIAAAQAGMHVISQKPMAPTLEDSVAMVDVCRKHGVRLLVHENWRWQPWYREIRKHDLGSPHYIGFRMRTGDGRGPAPYPSQPYFATMPRLLIYETLVHFIDTCRYLVGEIEEVYCRTQRLNPLIAGEDAAQIHLRFSNGAIGLIDANRIAGVTPSPVAFAEALIEGSEARITMTDTGDLAIRRHGDTRDTPIVFDKPQTGYKGDSILAMQRHFVECLRAGARCESEGEDYLRTVKTVFACYESAATNQPCLTR
jgi:predicted dehydrogenase